MGSCVACAGEHMLRGTQTGSYAVGLLPNTPGAWNGDAVNDADALHDDWVHDVRAVCWRVGAPLGEGVRQVGGVLWRVRVGDGGGLWSKLGGACCLMETTWHLAVARFRQGTRGLKRAAPAHPATCLQHGQHCVACSARGRQTTQRERQLVPGGKWHLAVAPWYSLAVTNSDQQHARQRHATRLTGNDVARVVADLALGAGRRTGVSHLAKARLKQLGQERGRVRQRCLAA